MTPTEVVCVAASDAVLDGLLTVFHLERSGGERYRVGVELPVEV